jgi:hypothetical protein
MTYSHDSKALSLARQVMALTRQTHIGGDVQLLAKIQCLFVEAMEYAAPQSFGNSEQLKSPVVPDGWISEAESLAELHGLSFVIFRPGEQPRCSDPTKVVISFTDKGLGHQPEEPKQEPNQ